MNVFNVSILYILYIILYLHCYNENKVKVGNEETLKILYSNGDDFKEIH